MREWKSKRERGKREIEIRRERERERERGKREIERGRERVKLGK